MIYWKVTVKNNQTNEIQIYKTRLGHGQKVLWRNFIPP